MILGRIKYFSAIFVCLVAVLNLTGSAAAASPSQVLTISPASVDTILQPGSTNNGSFEIINQGLTKYNLQIYATPYHVTGEDYQPGFTYLPGAPKVANWFSFATQQATIKSGQTETVHYVIKVPKNTPPGGYYAVAFAQTKLPEAANAVTVNERAGVIFYIQIAGSAIEKGQLVNWHVKLFQTPPLVSSVTLNNTGSVHYFSHIKINVKDIFGGLKYSVVTQKALLPKTIRLVNLSWPTTPKLGLYKVSGTATIFGQTKILPTRYVLVMSRAFQIVILILIILVIVFILTRLFRRFKTKTKEK